MRTKTIGFAITAIFAAVASGQAPADTQAQTMAAYEGQAPDRGVDAVRVFYLTHDETQQDIQEIVSLIRTEADIQRMFPYAARRAIALRGTPDQIALAEWLFHQLDKPANPQTQKAAAYEFPGPGGGAEAVRVFYLTHNETQQDIQEIINLIRTLSDTQRMFGYSSRRAIALRGTPAQAALAEWLFNELDKPANPQTQKAAAYEFPAPGGGAEAVRVFYFTHDETQQNLQEIINLIRTTADIQRIFPYSGRRAIALRGSASQIALAEWLIQKLDRP